jgi:hypothetical protein
VKNSGGTAPPLLHRITNTKATEMRTIRKEVITTGMITGIRIPRLNM